MDDCPHCRSDGLLSLFIDGVNLNTTPGDRTPWRQAKMARFNGTSWEPFGDIVTIQDGRKN